VKVILEPCMSPSMNVRVSTAGRHSLQTVRQGSGILCVTFEVLTAMRRCDAV
jgi:hypothetical protein